MKVTIERYRVLHLLVLTGCSFVLAEILIHKLGWTALSAYGMACTFTSQVSSAIYAQTEEEEVDAAELKRKEKRERVAEKRRERRIWTGGSGKKKNR